MTSMRGRSAGPDEIERCLRRAYPTRALEELEVAVLDQDLGSDRLRFLSTRVAQVPSATAVLEPEVAKSHILRVGRADAPDWEELNREMGPRARIAAVAERDGGIHYWMILLSRLGPFWAEYWNVFRVRSGMVVPELASPPADPEWMNIRGGVRAVLDAFGLREVDSTLLHQPVPWLRLAPAGVVDAWAADRTITLYDALFSDL